MRNIPDGEVYSAPVIDSVNGKIKFNTVCPQNGRMFTGISLTFRNGKAVEAGADNYVDDLQKILDTDSGSRYTGEFAFGLNPFINRAVGDTLFDEKSPVPFIWRSATFAATPVTATVPAFTGIWCKYKRRNTAAAKSGLTMC